MQTDPSRPQYDADLACGGHRWSSALWSSSFSWLRGKKGPEDPVAVQLDGVGEDDNIVSATRCSAAKIFSVDRA